MTDLLWWGLGAAAAGAALWVLAGLARAAWTVFAARMEAIRAHAAAVGGEAVGSAVAVPFELLLIQADKATAFAAEWRAQRKIWRTEFRGKMPWSEFREMMTGRKKAARDDYADALDVLGLSEPFKRADLDARFKRFSDVIHPDKGGSAHLMRQLNDARGLVLRRKGWRR